jgi:RimJ/RimL family protein N-acetyltransferase
MPEAHLPDALETDRLTLRPLTLADLDEMATLFGDAEGLRLWGPPFDRAETRAWIERNLARYARDGFGRCAVILRSTGELVGDCGLIATEVEGTPEVELGWIVRRSHWGQGLATEAGSAWLSYAFWTLRLGRVVSMIVKPNTASRRVAEKLGMSVERTALWGGDEPYLMYAIARPIRPG